MVPSRRRAIVIAAAVSVFVLAIVGSAVSMRNASTSESNRSSFHQIVADHDGVISARAVADRSPLDLRQIHSKLLLLAWISLLLVAALLARTAGRTVELRSGGSGSVVPASSRSNRGPPAVLFA